MITSVGLCAASPRLLVISNECEKSVFAGCGLSAAIPNAGQQQFCIFMQQMKKIIIVLFLATTLVTCTNNTNLYNGFKLPQANEYNQIIAAILKQDTTFIHSGFLNTEYIGADLTEIKIRSTTLKRDTANTQVLTEDFSVFHVNIRELRHYFITNPDTFKIDSLYFAFQNDSAKPLVIDTTIISFVKIATDKMKKQNRGKNTFGYFQFSQPVFNKNLSKAYVQADLICNGLCGEGMTYILEKVNNKWKLKFAIVRWVG